MLQQLRKHLILLFTSLSSLILTISIIIALLLNLRQIESHSLESYRSIQDDINYKLQTDQLITHNWLSQMETKYKLIIHIKEKEYPFSIMVPGILSLQLHHRIPKQIITLNARI